MCFPTKSCSEIALKGADFPSYNSEAKELLYFIKKAEMD